MAEYAKDVLVETDEVASWGGSKEGVVLVEVDEDTSLYQKGHIPGAVSWDWSSDLHDLPRREFVDSDAIAKLLARSGVTAGDTVVLYAGNNNWFACYAYWVLKYRGFDNVKILNGGRKKWELEGRELQSEPVTPTPATNPPKVAGSRADLRALREEVILAVNNKGAFVDVRSPEEFRGELLAPPHLPQEQAQVPGHIPGAANITWAKAARDDGTFKSADELTELYQKEGITKDLPEVIAYCRIGERSSHSWFVLRELLGFDNVKNYDGSWTEYGSLVGVPVEKG
ncbi:MAG TPA: sulfurtransferase [Actinomycetota bacterium]|nr:sulfurtransferase [Actinomycetota bacterium]